MPRFERGNSVARGHGRPRNLSAAYLDSTFEECDLPSWRAIVRRAVLDAKAGNPRARTWLSAILIPEPAVATTVALDVPAIAALVGQWIPDQEEAKAFALAVLGAEQR